MLFHLVLFDRPSGQKCFEPIDRRRVHKSVSNASGSHMFLTSSQCFYASFGRLIALKAGTDLTCTIFQQMLLRLIFPEGKILLLASPTLLAILHLSKQVELRLSVVLKYVRGRFRYDRLPVIISIDVTHEDGTLLQRRRKSFNRNGNGKSSAAGSNYSSRVPFASNASETSLGRGCKLIPFQTSI